MGKVIMRDFAVNVKRGTRGRETVTVRAPDLAMALTNVLRQTQVPLGDVRWARVRPICRYCDKPSTHYTVEGEEPICGECARGQTDGPLVEYVRQLNIGRWDDAFGECEWITGNGGCPTRQSYRMVGRERAVDVLVVKGDKPYCDVHAAKLSELVAADLEPFAGK